MDSIKDNIIFNVFEYMENKDLQYSLRAQEYLQLLAKNFHVTIKKTSRKPEIKNAFKLFILNGKGYNITINELFNAL